MIGNSLYTSRLELRRVDRQDVSCLVNWSNSIKASGDYLTPERYDPRQLEEKIASGVLWSKDERMFLAHVKESGNPIGTVHYWQPSGKKDTVTMAVKVAVPEERGKGYGTEIQKFVIMHIFTLKPTHCVEMYTDINNTPQQRCLKKLGFELVESLTYEDQQQMRTGNLYRLSRDQYAVHPIYRYHYE